MRPTRSMTSLAPYTMQAGAPCTRPPDLAQAPGGSAPRELEKARQPLPQMSATQQFPRREPSVGRDSFRVHERYRLGERMAGRLGRQREHGREVLGLLGEVYEQREDAEDDVRTQVGKVRICEELLRDAIRVRAHALEVEAHRSCVPAVAEEDLGNKGWPMLVSSEPQPKIPVLESLEARIEEPAALEAAPSNQQHPDRKSVAEGECASEVRVQVPLNLGRHRLPLEDSTGGISRIPGAEHEVGSRPRLQHL